MDDIFNQWLSASSWAANGADANRPVYWDATPASSRHNSTCVMPTDSAADFPAQHKASSDAADTGQEAGLPLQPMPPAWYIGGVPSAGGGLSSEKVQGFEFRPVDPPVEDPFSGKWQQDDDCLSTDGFPWNTPHLAASEGMKYVQSSEDQIAVAQDPSGETAGKASKVRVRARRGQATDPHSIAERHRRERIAERMKALQELVPDSNKTDKASMLDEIIGYVKFLQMQVKCLSMCRLGGAGAATPLLADLPVEGTKNPMATSMAPATSSGGGSSNSLQESVAFAETQVARLMDEDMSAAMQYLQSKGLCLMPISLATAISSSGVRVSSTKMGPNVSDGDMQRKDGAKCE